MIVIGTANPDKVTEVAALPAAEGLEICCAGTFGTPPEIIEDGATFIANAIIKAKAYSRWLNLEFGIEPLVIAEDSGLQVDALNGWPGVLSARVADSAAERINTVLERLQGDADRSARFIAVTALVKAGTVVNTWEGTVTGVIAAAPRGTGGFGYDPIFEIPGQNRTFAEMETAAKNELSHRRIAWTRTFNEMRSLGLLPDRRSMTRDVGLI